MTAINAVTDLTVDADIAVLTLDSPPVNALSAAVRSGIRDGMARALADDAVTAVVLICAGKTFVAGADITEFGKPPAGPSLAEVQAMIEDAPKPVVAAIHGTALGGGLELALVCHYRIATRSAKCGLPEVNLGLLPGAGGTQRLPRIVGPEMALEMVTSGAHVAASAAAEMGLVDLLTDDASLRADAVAFARKVVAEKRPLRKVRESDDKVAAARGKPELFAAFRKANARRIRGFDAPEFNIRCIEAAVELPFEAGLKRERELFTELLNGTQSAAQRYYFFASRQVWNVPDVGADTPALAVKRIGIVGAGTMGGGIAMNFLNAGYPVTIVETSQQALDRGLKTIRGNYENTARKGRLSAADVEARMALLTPTLDLQRLADADLIIEAVFENMEVKQELFGKLDRIARSGAILATNTSALDVNVIAASTSRPEAVIGLHFFSPANVMKLLEVVRGDKTAKPVIRTAMELARKIGKVAALVGVCPGFVGNRMLAQRQREAQKLVLDGALPWDVDRVLYDFGFPMGPFAMSDLAGLDLGWVREKSSGSTLREVLCEMDRRGQKAGAGYYDYDEQRNAKPSPVVEQVIRDFAAKQGRTGRAVSEQEILERCIYPMINEGAKILQEGKAIRASDIDVIWVNGYGWPVYRGGPMCYADTIGLDQVLAAMRRYEALYGADFAPAPLLEELVARGRGFADLK
ncbi:3-hydroxyacyl-CoA dehydrogenase NAD-binding domain-containing protein [Cupriavidus sp. BIC8F]|uniref:3-hydroxyacyl-CoA dehydrogenase NAD-binding domain-containing protein n=1 Tax=Cupriavidus sp. BIC8F TaxID=3079014 RepID=UPI002916EA63|nr:3-hydroxyacyl-CoA dehydrogenase NAD-binding domain-containing protein [Cupriavidus sp. BIC8F]